MLLIMLLRMLLRRLRFDYAADCHFAAMLTLPLRFAIAFALSRPLPLSAMPFRFRCRRHYLLACCHAMLLYYAVFSAPFFFSPPFRRPSQLLFDAATLIFSLDFSRFLLHAYDAALFSRHFSSLSFHY